MNWGIERLYWLLLWNWESKYGSYQGKASNEELERTHCGRVQEQVASDSLARPTGGNVTLWTWRNKLRKDTARAPFKPASVSFKSRWICRRTLSFPSTIMKKPREYCCCAIPLVNAGIYATLIEQTVLGILVGTLAFATPSSKHQSFRSRFLSMTDLGTQSLVLPPSLGRNGSYVLLHMLALASNC